MKNLRMMYIFLVLNEVNIRFIVCFIIVIFKINLVKYRFDNKRFVFC